MEFEDQNPDARTITMQPGTMSTLDPSTGTQHTQYIAVVNWGPTAEYTEHWNVALRWHELKELHATLKVCAAQTVAFNGCKRAQ